MAMTRLHQRPEIRDSALCSHYFHSRMAGLNDFFRLAGSRLIVAEAIPSSDLQSENR